MPWCNISAALLTTCCKLKRARYTQPSSVCLRTGWSKPSGAFFPPIVKSGSTSSQPRAAAILRARCRASSACCKASPASWRQVKYEVDQAIIPAPQDVQRSFTRDSGTSQREDRRARGCGHVPRIGRGDGATGVWECRTGRRGQPASLGLAGTRTFWRRLEVCLAPAAKVPWFYRDNCSHAGHWYWGQYRGVQHLRSHSVAAAAFLPAAAAL